MADGDAEGNAEFQTEGFAEGFAEGVAEGVAEGGHSDEVFFSLGLEVNLSEDLVKKMEALDGEEGVRGVDGGLRDLQISRESAEDMLGEFGDSSGDRGVEEIDGMSEP